MGHFTSSLTNCFAGMNRVPVTWVGAPLGRQVPAWNNRTENANKFTSVTIELPNIAS